MLPFLNWIKPAASSTHTPPWPAQPTADCLRSHRDVKSVVFDSGIVSDIVARTRLV